MDESISCGGCGKKFAWTPDLAGKRGKCKCGEVVEFPFSSPAVADDIYDVADEPQPVKSASPKPAPKPGPVAQPGTSKVPAGPMRPVPARAGSRGAVLGYQANRVEVAATRDSFIDQVRDMIVPFSMLAAGLVLMIVNAHFGWTWQSTMVANFLAMFVMGIIEVIMLVAIAFFCAHVVSVTFGPTLFTAILKLAAMAFLVGAIARIIDAVIPDVGWLFAWAFVVLSYLGLLIYLFDHDMSDSWLVVMVLGVAKYVLSILLPVILLGLFMSSASTGGGMAGAIVAGVGTAAEVADPKKVEPVIIEPDLPPVRVDESMPLAQRKGIDFVKDINAGKKDADVEYDGRELLREFDVMLVQGEFTPQTFVSYNLTDSFKHEALSLARGMQAWDAHGESTDNGRHGVAVIEIRDQPWKLVLRRDIKSDFSSRRNFYIWVAQQNPKLEMIVLGVNDNAYTDYGSELFYMRFAQGKSLGESQRFDASSVTDNPWPEDPKLMADWKELLPRYFKALKDEADTRPRQQAVVDAYAQALKDMEKMYSRLVAVAGGYVPRFDEKWIPQTPGKENDIKSVGIFALK
jgi:hypothetical protein